MNEICLCCLLQSQDSRTLPPEIRSVWWIQIGCHVLGNFTNLKMGIRWNVRENQETLTNYSREREFLNQQVCALLIFSNFSQSLCTRSKPTLLWTWNKMIIVMDKMSIYIYKRTRWCRRTCILRCMLGCAPSRAFPGCSSLFLFGRRCFGSGHFPFAWTWRSLRDLGHSRARV